MPFKLSFPLMGLVATVLMYSVVFFSQTPPKPGAWAGLAALAVINLLGCFVLGHFVDKQSRKKPTSKGDKPCCKCQQ